MDEQTAKTKWCPHVRIRFDGADEPACNMQKADWASGEKRPKCIASDCMLWVEDTIPEYEGIRRREAGEIRVLGGHCGLVR